MLCVSLFRLVTVGVMLSAASMGGAASSSEAGRPTSAAPTTLVTVAGSIDAFAQDGNMLAWASGAGDCPQVRVRAARGGTVAVVQPDTDGGDACYLIGAFALGGTRVVWGGFEDCCNNGYGTVETDAPRSKPETLRDLGQDYHSWGDFLTGAAGDGGTLVYSMTTIELTAGKEVDGSEGWIHCLPSDPCTWDVTGGGVWRVVGTREARVPGAPPTALVAAAGGRIALVPTDSRRFPGPCTIDDSGCPEIRTADGARVEIRNVVSGKLVASFAPRGRVTAIAFDADTVAVLVRSGQKARVDWYRANSGRRVGTAPVARTVADTLGVSQRAVVLQSGHTIFGLDLTSGRMSVLAQARSEPMGLSIQGTRVAWAEKSGSRGAIRAVTVG